MIDIQVLLGKFFGSVALSNPALHRTRSQKRIDTASKVATCFEKNSTPPTVCK